MSNAIIKGGPSKAHRLPNQDEIDAAAQALTQRGPQPYMKGVPLAASAPVTSLPLATPPPSAVGQQLYGTPDAEATPDADEAERHDGKYSLFRIGEDVHVTLWLGGDAYTGEGASVVEALSVAAGKLEEGLEAPRCQHCGQILPEHLQERSQ